MSHDIKYIYVVTKIDQKAQSYAHLLSCKLFHNYDIEMMMFM